MKKAVILFSGGLDSTTCLAYATAQGFDCYALSFEYGQRHEAELKAAETIARIFNAKHKIFALPINQFGGSALTDWRIDVPDHQVQPGAIPITYVPARNTIFLSIALAFAEILGAYDLFIGVSAVDYSGYPDCRPEYIDAFETMANLAMKQTVESGRHLTIHTPLLHLSKAQTIALGHALDVDYGLTVSCYCASPQGLACGHCGSCMLRKKGFAEAQVEDPTLYKL